jgi:hypothetical protein
MTLGSGLGIPNIKLVFSCPAESGADGG